jgi:3-oxoacyl-[acyl-carrier protein] reductase
MNDIENGGLKVSLKGKIALVTGGGTGIGRAIAQNFAASGADVAVAGRTASTLEKVCGSIHAMGRRAVAVTTDVSSRNDVEGMANQVLNELGPIDILVNNAGIGILDGQNALPVHKLPEDMWDTMIDTNLKGTYLCIKAVSEQMIERKRGNIINIGSVAGLFEGANPYALAKSGVIRMTLGLASQLGQYNIRINGIAPGLVKVEAGVMLTEAEVQFLSNSESIGGIPLQRAGLPQDVANAALFLASDASSYITGHTITVDGGMLSGKG